MLIVIIAMSYEPPELLERRSTNTLKEPTDDLQAPDKVDDRARLPKWYARMKLERKEREEMRIKEGTMVETKFKVRIQCSSCERIRWECQKRGDVGKEMPQVENCGGSLGSPPSTFCVRKCPPRTCDVIRGARLTEWE